MFTPLLEARSLTKSFPGVRALKGVSLSVQRGGNSSEQIHRHPCATDSEEQRGRVLDRPESEGRRRQMTGDRWPIVQIISLDCADKSTSLNAIRAVLPHP